jgi:phosphoenolpyruvate---glycerone phosphotransferase subunit DhaL
MPITQPDILAWLEELQRVYAQNKPWLTELDAAIGDADHGINLERGFSAVQAELARGAPQDISGTLKSVAMTLIRTVGGASGPLYGTFFLRASAACAGKAALLPADLVALFRAGVEGVQQRGKAELDDKTMLDALWPALEAMQGALQEGLDLKPLLLRAVAAAQMGMNHTVPLQARKGRASYLGERSIGHQDPGATSAFLLLDAAARVWGGG